jgi:hypothetical protein
MAKLQSTEIVGVANRPATICSNSVCIWFDTTNTKIVYSYCGYSGAGAWSAGGAMITARRYLAGVGTQNEGLSLGGLTTVVVSCTEEYNGTSWSVGGVLITARRALAGAGTQNEGLAFGGFNGSNLSCTEEYNGTSWSAGGLLITARQCLSGGGTQGAGLAFGGCSGSNLSCTEEYNKPLAIIDCIK